MYEPAWYPEKSLTGVAEAVALLASALAVLLGRKLPRESPAKPG